MHVCCSLPGTHKLYLQIYSCPTKRLSEGEAAWKTQKQLRVAALTALLCSPPITGHHQVDSQQNIPYWMEEESSSQIMGTFGVSGALVPPRAAHAAGQPAPSSPGPVYLPSSSKGTQWNEGRAAPCPKGGAFIVSVCNYTINY